MKAKRAIRVLAAACFLAAALSASAGSRCRTDQAPPPLPPTVPESLSAARAGSTKPGTVQQRPRQRRLVTPSNLWRPILRRRVRFATAARPILKVSVAAKTTCRSAVRAGESSRLPHEVMADAAVRAGRHLASSDGRSDLDPRGTVVDVHRRDAHPRVFDISPASLTAPVFRRRIFKKP